MHVALCCASVAAARTHVFAVQCPVVHVRAGHLRGGARACAGQSFGPTETSLVDVDIIYSRIDFLMYASIFINL